MKRDQRLQRYLAPRESASQGLLSTVGEAGLVGLVTGIALGLATGHFVLSLVPGAALALLFAGIAVAFRRL